MELGGAMAHVLVEELADKLEVVMGVELEMARAMR